MSHGNACKYCTMTHDCAIQDRMNQFMESMNIRTEGQVTIDIKVLKCGFLTMEHTPEPEEKEV